MKTGIRQKTYYMGNRQKPEYIEIDLFPVIIDQGRRISRARRHKVSAPQQKNLNHKNAARYFRQLIKGNFTENDYYMTFTYGVGYLPANIEDAEKEMRNYILRIKRRCAKLGLSVPKYIWLTETTVKDQRPHHHMVISCQLSRDELERLWSKRGKLMGYTNAKVIRPDSSSKGLEDLAAYLSKDPKGRKRWHPSRNLRKPEVSTNDNACSRKQYMQLSLWPEDCEEARNYFERRFTSYYVTEIVKEYNHITGQWAIYAKLRKKPDSPGREKRK